MTNLSKNGRILFATLGLILGYASCGISDNTVTANGGLAMEIIGTWRTAFVDTEWGRMRFEFAFGKNGVLAYTMSDGQFGPVDSQTFLYRYIIVGDQLIHVPGDNEANQKIHISGNTLTLETLMLEDGSDKVQFVRKSKRESVARFIAEAIKDLKSPDVEVRW